ncbi:MAG: M6 family metalloprotease domain-containing protein [Bacteroides sp.]|nr:M6 family metalloprotease domain-containing protein [Bacteroidales bacterium]MBD5368925.1 M6 family metalloprotease domain-containing protein [Bacteroides sp.]
MSLTTFKKYILAGSFLAAAAIAGAVPAKPEWRTVTQPDGTEITVRTFGDERFHYTLTDNQRLVTQGEDGAYRFATLDASGAIVATQFMAAPEASLSADARSFLSSVSATDMVNRASTSRSGREMFKVGARVPENMLTSSFPSMGEQPVLVVLVEYQDVKFTIPDPQDYYHRMLNEEGFSDDNGTGSARDYFLESSNNKFRPRFDVYRPITLSREMSYYGGNGLYGSDLHPEEMAIEACTALDPEVDFSQYDCDNDGLIDNVFVIYAGYGEADGGSSSTVWPHAYWIYNGAMKTVYLDGKLLDHYACSNELNISNVPCGIGTTVHEFSHVMGLPDLYTTNGASYHTPLEWSVLDYGCYLNDGRTPPAYSTFERLSMGWIDPIELSDPSEVMVPDLSTNVAFIVNTDDPNEFFLFENRQKNGWDQFIPYHGMLIWRIAFNKNYWTSNSVNNYAAQHVDVLEAGGERSSFGTPFAATSDPWPGSLRKTTFSAQTSPAFATLEGVALPHTLTDIAESNGIVTFKFNDGTSRIAAPTDVKASDIQPRSASLTWKAVDGAKGYLLTVAADGATRADLNHVHVGTVTSYDLTDLIPETDYYVSVMAIGNSCVSDESAELKFTTGEAGFSDRNVVALPATSITASTFVASWEAFNDASAYLLTVNEVIPATVFSENATYDSNKLPEGWTTTASGKYVIPSNCGESAPALRLNKLGENIVTSVKKGDITLLKFWLRGTNATSTENKVTVYGLTTSEAWETITEVTISTTGRVVTLPIEKGYHAIKLEYTGATTGSYPIAIDDIFISGGDSSYEEKVIDALNVGNVTSYTVTGLNVDAVYNYTVTATDGTLLSLPSAPVTVKLDPNAAGIESITPDADVTITGGQFITITGTDADATVFTPQGMTVYHGPRRTITLPAGLYIVRVGGNVAKVIIRR